MLPNSATIDNYGGVKQDRVPATNRATTLAAAEHNAAAGDLAMMSRMAPRAFRRFVGGNPPTEPALALSHDALWAGDAPPVDRIEEGLYWVQFPGTVVDELGNEQPLQLRWAMAWEETTAPHQSRVAARVDPTKNVVEIHCVAEGGGGASSDDLVGMAICVLVW